jgi:hypothetical protein
MPAPDTLRSSQDVRVRGRFVTKALLRMVKWSADLGRAAIAQS